MNNIPGHVRPGGHDFLPYDFKLFLDFCDGRLSEII